MTWLSHSIVEKYKTCPAMYKLHYIDRIRSSKIGSALIFGNAFDEAMNLLLKTKMDNPEDDATDDLEKLYECFDHHMTYQTINTEVEDVRTSHFIEYFGSDFDRDILTPEDISSLGMFIENAGYVIDPNNPEKGTPDPFDLYDEISGYIKEKVKINSTDRSYYNYCSWLSMRRKGHMMICHYKEEILPKIKRVLSVQKRFELPNDDDDRIIGYIDFEAELEGLDGMFTIDNKTSSKPYKMEDINNKGQLLIYDEYTQHGQAAYIVLNKKIKYEKKLTCLKCGAVTRRSVRTCPEGGTGKKRCNGELTLEKIPYIKSQILTDTVDEEKKDLIFEEICDILEKIENKEFPQNRDSCFQYGRKCVYYDFCRSNPLSPNVEGLSKV